MPDRKAKIKFDADYLQSIEKHITACRTMYNRIPAKYKPLHWNDLNNAIGTLQSIKNYAAINGRRIPPRAYAPITHNDTGNRYLNKGKQGVRELYNAIPSRNRKGIENGYRKALDCIVVFQTQLVIK